MIKVQFEYQLNELRAGIWAINRAGGYVRRISLFFGGTLALICGAEVWVYVSTKLQPVPGALAFSRGLVPNLGYAPGIPAAIFILGLWAYIIFRLRRANTEKNTRLLGQLWNLEISEEFLTLGDATQRSEFRWTAFSKFTETTDFFLAFTDRMRAVIIPKRVLDTASTAELRELALRNVHPQTGGFPVIPLAEPAREETKLS